MEPRSPTLQAGSLLVEPQGKPKNTRVGSLSLLQWIFLTQELNRGLLHCRQILYQLSYQGSPKYPHRHYQFDLSHLRHKNLCVCSVAQLYLTLSCNPMDYSPPGTSAHGIFQARILEWGAISSSKVSSRPRDQTCISFIACICRHILYH